jgi:Uma2 family endonuclease
LSKCFRRTARCGIAGKSGYEKIAALHTYALVSQERREVQIFRRKPEGGWTREVLPEAGQEFRVPELEFALSLDAMYARTGL